jgi:hypothetical protein
MLSIFQATNPTEQDDLSACTSARPQAQPSQKKQSKLLKTILYPYYAARTPVSPFIFGIGY